MLKDDLQGHANVRGLTELEDIVVGSTFAVRAFEIPRDADIMAQLRDLRHLRRSLEQYLQRTANLTYVGFVGHFSSGKSSVINSILGFRKGLPHWRKTGKHPTDDVITLLINERNSDDLLRISVTNGLRVAFDTLDHPFLQHIVVADTPGTGDPAMKEEDEKVHDFLPICDLVVFVVSAAQPLDRADKKALQSLVDRLRFIPMVFVITRADEFKRNKLEAISETNYDFAAEAELLNDLKARLATLFSADQFTDTDFLVIDNEESFRIDALRDHLLSRCDPHNALSRLGIHSHKIQFYLESAKRCREVFVKHTECKIHDLHQVVTQAKINIQHYDHCITVSNTDLTRSWHDRGAQLTEICSKAAIKPSAIAPLQVHLKSTERVATLATAFSSTCTRLAKSAAEAIVKRNKEAVLLRISDLLSSLKDRLQARVDFDYLLSELEPLGDFQDKVTLEGARDLLSAGTLIDFAADYRHECRASINESLSPSKALLVSLKDQLRNSTVVESCRDVISAARKDWATDLDKYFSSVEVYRAGVFALGNGALTAHLAIDRDELIQLYGEFTEDFKTTTAENAQESMFPQVEEVFVTTKHRFSEIEETVVAIEATLAQLVIPAPPKLVEWIEGQVESRVSRLTTELEYELSQETRSVCFHLSEELSETLASSDEAYGVSLADAKRRLKLLYRYIAATLTVVSTTLATAYAFWGRTARQTVGPVIFYGVVGNVIVTMTTIWMAKLRENFPERRRQILHKNISLTLPRINAVIEKILHTHKWISLEQAVLTQRLVEAYSQVTKEISAERWQRESEAQYEAARVLQDRANRLQAEYLTAVEKCTGRCQEYFGVSRNTKKVQQISQDVKGKAIQLTFDLLEKTRSNLAVLLRRLQSLSFS